MIVANRIFTLGLLGYFISYILPFADNYFGLDIEVEVWGNIVTDSRSHNLEIAILWSFRWLTNFMVLGLWWLKTPEVRRWVIHLTNKDLLDKILLLIILIFVSYPFLFENFTWQIGGILWATSAITIAFSYQFLHTPAPPMEAGIHLERHLVDFGDEDEK